MRSAVSRGLVFAAVFFVIYVIGHLLVVPWLAARFPTFEQWNYGVAETLISGAVIGVFSGAIMSFLFSRQVRR